MRNLKSTVKVNISQKEYEDLQKGARPFYVAYTITTLFGLTVAGTGILYMFGINTMHASGNPWAAVGVGGLFAGASLFKMSLRYYSQRLIPENQLYEKLNVNYQTLNTIMRDHEVQPRLVINGERFYTRTDFGDIATLLRASAAPPPAADTLLRPATGNTVTPQEQLLRPSAESAEEEKPMASFAAPPNAHTHTSDEETVSLSGQG